MACEPDLDINSIFLRKKLEHKKALVMESLNIINGVKTRSDKKARVAAQKWEPHIHTLEKILANEDLDEPRDFGSVDGENQPANPSFGNPKSNQLHASPLFVTVPIKPRLTEPSKPPKSKAEWITAKEEIHQRFIHTRDLKLRQWYTEAHSDDPEVQLDAQIRLYIQFLLRDQRALTQSYNQRRNKYKAVGDVHSLTDMREKLPYSIGTTATIVRMAKGVLELPKDMATQAAEWWSKGHNLVEVLGGTEWDTKQEFGVTKHQTEASRALEEQSVGEEEEEEEALMPPSIMVPSDDEIQQRFERTRDSKLRQWYTEAQSPDQQVRIAARVRLHL